MPMMRMLTRITSTITISHMPPLLRSEKGVEVRRDTGDISVMVDVECENDQIDPWAEANISAFLTIPKYLVIMYLDCSWPFGRLPPYINQNSNQPTNPKKGISDSVAGGEMPK